MNQNSVSIEEAQVVIQKIALLLDGLPSSMQEQVSSVVVETEAIIGMFQEPGQLSDELSEHLSDYHQKNIILLSQLESYQGERSTKSKTFFQKALKSHIKK